MGFFALMGALGGSSGALPSISLPPSTTKTGTTASLTTNSITATVSGGVPPYSFTWSQLTGGAITINSPSAQSSSFSASGLSAGGETRSGTFQCIVSDGLGRTSSATITVTVQRYAALAVSASPSAINQTTDSSTITTTQSDAMVITGGSGTYAPSWVKVSGDVITAVTPSALSTAFRAGGMAAGEVRSAIFTANASDSVSGQSATSSTITVTISRPGSLSASASPSNISGAGNGSTVTTTGSVTTTGTGGSGVPSNYNYQWSKLSGGAITATAANAASTAFQASSLAAGEVRTATFQCSITDSVTGQTTATGSVTVTISRYAALSASISPATVNASGSSSTVTSGAATVTPSGGSGSFGYSWTKASGGSIVAVSPGNPSTTFTASGLTPGEQRTATFNCVVTDSVTGSTLTKSVSVTITNSEAATYTPTPGRYSSGNNFASSSSFTINASDAVQWTWSVSNGGTANVANGQVANSITFSVTGPIAGGSTIITVSTPDGSSWIITLNVTSSGGTQ